MKISDIYKKVIEEGSGYNYGCVMLLLNCPKEWWNNICDEIDKDDIYNPDGERNYGIQQASESHVTILYGLHSDIPDYEIEELINKMTSPKVTLKDITVFENDDFDVVKFDVDGEELYNMNEMFSKLPHTTDYPHYHPHCTIGYVKSGSGNKYKRRLSNDESLTIKPTKVIYSKANGEKKEYKLTKDGKLN